jgi:hypothetical protein
MEDPQDIPLFDLEAPATLDPLPEDPLVPAPLVDSLKMDTIFEIEGSENFTQNLQRSPRMDIFSTNSKSREFSLGEPLEEPKRMRVRMRSQSDNSEYLIFNFLERVSEKYSHSHTEAANASNSTDLIPNMLFPPALVRLALPPPPHRTSAVYSMAANWVKSRKKMAMGQKSLGIGHSNHSCVDGIVGSSVTVIHPLRWYPGWAQSSSNLRCCFYL